MHVFDPSGTDPYGLIEIKCPFKYCDLYPEEASRQTDFFCTLSMKDGRQIVELKHNHPYFAQIQGQLSLLSQSGHGVILLCIQKREFRWNGFNTVRNLGGIRYFPS